MMTPAQAMLWQIWRGWRWGLILGWAYMLVAAVLARLLPDLLRRTPAGEAFLSHAALELSLPCAFLLIHLAAAFSLTGADLKERGYWKTMFVLPVRTRTLVAWPMIWGSLALGCVWLFIACFIVRPMGNTVPLVWPIAALAAGLTLLQALSWLPLEQTWLRIIIAVPPIALVATGVAMVAVFEIPEPIAAVIFGSLLPLTYVAALRGVAAARRGDAFDWRLWNRLVAWAAVLRKPSKHPFRSAARAQLWFECRSFAWVLPLSTALMATLIGFMTLLDHGSDAELHYWKLLPIVLLMPALLAGVVGCQHGNASFPFIATRPVSSIALVRSKFELAAVSALAAYLPVFLVASLFFLSPSFFDSVLQAARAAGTPRTTMILMAAVVFPVLLTWKGLVESLWMGLTGRPWLVNVFTFGLAILFGCGTLFGLWLAFYPAMQALLWSLMPWLIGLVLTLKMLVATWVLYRLIRLGLVRPTTAGLMFAAWGLIVAALCLAAHQLIPSQILSTSSAIAAIVVLIPFSRLAAAPLALEWNRHR